MISVVVAEDQLLMQAALIALLRTERDLSVVGRAADGQEALRVVTTERPSILLADVEMPLMSGIELAAEVQRTRLPTRVVILTTFARPGYLRRALDAGAVGYLLKDSRPEMFCDAIRRAHQGLRVIDARLARDHWALLNPLTTRERELLQLATEGLSSLQIAKSLGLSEGTVRNHFSQAMAKLNAVNRFEAARIARDEGWL